MNLSNLFEKFELITEPCPNSLLTLMNCRVRIRVNGYPIESPSWVTQVGKTPYNPEAIRMLRVWYDSSVAPRLPKPLNDVLRADYSKPLPAPRPFLMLGKPKVVDMRLKNPAPEPQPTKPKPVAPKEPRSRKFDFSI